MIDIFALTSDKHVGSALGLCPPYFELEKGGRYEHNEGQRWTWDRWISYWTDVRDLKTRMQNENPRRIVRVLAVNIGDSSDKDVRGIEKVTYNPTEILRLAVRVHQPQLDIADYHWWIRGTIAHEGQMGWMAEKLAEDVGGVKYSDTQWSWWKLGLESCGVSMDFYHRPQTRGMLPNTEPTAPPRQSYIIRSRCAESGVLAPDLAVFGHVHYWGDSGLGYKPRVIYLPGWQLPYDWIHNIGLGYAPQAVGGVIIVCKDGGFDVIPKIYHLPEEERWKTENLPLRDSES